MEFKHYSVLLDESIEGLNINPSGIYVDCTLGGGGHSSEILKRLNQDGFLYAFDQDINAIEASNERLKQIGSNYEIINSNFVNLKEELNNRNVSKVDGFIYDLGVSSPQFDNPERGFSYNYDARLDMRMDVNQSLSAYEVVNEYRFEDLYYIISRYGEESFAKSIAREIERTRIKKPIETTFELVEVIKRAVPAKARREKHPAKRTFQAIRIAVNQELDVIKPALEDSIDLIKVNGRICVITFHSLEDKIVKTLFKEYSSMPELPKGLPVFPSAYQPVLQMINRKAIIANETELEENNRSHSAKLRIVEKLREKD
ncbi:MAG: rsmH [Haloplasmataceae bacterium]|jgi:16S rRNA (cytosine1402-N4)-methyltransferase|nr:rsmH [Haloplasmataceae bacterium]